MKLVRAIVPAKHADDHNSLFIVGDAHQRIYARKASMLACGIEVRGRARRLRLNYRTTEEIRRYAVAILEGVEVDDLDDGADTLQGYRSLRLGKPPIRAGFKSKSEELKSLVTWLQGCDDTSSIAILVRTNAHLKEIDAALTSAGILTFILRNNVLDDPKKAGIRIATMHRAKGLEFDNVAMALLSQETTPPRQAINAAVDKAGRREIMEREKSLLHVAGTRAKSTLRISWHGTIPEIVKQ